MTAGRLMFSIAGFFMGFSTTTTRPESEFRGQHIKPSTIETALSIKCVLCILNTTDNKDRLICILEITLISLVLSIILLVYYYIQKLNINKG